MVDPKVFKAYDVRGMYPGEIDGVKIGRRGALPVGGESGLLELRDRALGLVGSDRLGGGAGRVSSYDIWPAYVDRVLAFIDISVVRPLKVVIDAANGMAGTM